MHYPAPLTTAQPTHSRSRKRRSARPLGPRHLHALALAAALCGASQAAEIAPYFQSWGPGTLTAAQKNGLSSATLAFGITRGSCALDATLSNMLPDASP